MTGGESADAHAALGHALIRYFPGNAAVLIRSHERRWCSATFSGRRHLFVFDVDGQGGSDARRRVGQLCDQEFALTGHLVADVCVVEFAESVDQPMRLEIEALTVEVQ